MVNKVLMLFSVIVLASACVGQSQDENKQHDAGGKVLFDDIDSEIIYSHGPTKRMMAEQYLNSVKKLTGHDFGDYSFVTGDRTGSFRMLCENLGGCPDHVNRFRSQDVNAVSSLTFDDIANRACIKDRKAVDMMPPDANENSLKPAKEEIISAIRWQYIHFFGDSPDDSEMSFSLRFINDHLNKIDPDTGLSSAETRRYSFGTALRSHCFVLLTSSKFIYY
ncbi:hypothetical protein MNBD_GAMMA09-2443 [hydrothermal vent metagenome]|uniref:Uncharacterized protein n=1 Tax=hydrothermal vent metagenome TaxID=652676 RepID=A0A3B0XR55_9ZZZZ